MLACIETPVTRHLDAGEVGKAAARYLRGINDAPALVSVEPPDHPGYGTRLHGRLPRHGLIVPWDTPPDRSYNDESARPANIPGREEAEFMTSQPSA
jgi:hypothetical protein